MQCIGILCRHMVRSVFIAGFCLFQLGYANAQETQYSVSGYTMTTGRNGSVMESSILVLSVTLPQQSLMILPFIVKGTASSAVFTARFNGKPLTAFTTTDLVDGYWNTLHVDVSAVKGQQGELEVELTSSDPMSVVMVEEARQPDGWPWSYSGQAPGSALNLNLNNIGYMSAADGRIYSCVQIMTNGVQGSLKGISRFDIAFDVALARSEVKVVKARPFNPTNAKTVAGETPACSGRFETTTSRYTDTIIVGNNTYNVSFNMIDGNAMLLRLTGATKL